MAEEEPVDTEATGRESAPDIESQIKTAMNSRVSYFQKQSDSLTFEGVRRLIEKDLGLDMHALDVHKRFIKQCLVECLDGSEDVDASNNPKETEQNIVQSEKGDALESPEGLESKKEIVEPGSENEDKMEDSPVMGLLITQKVKKSDPGRTQGTGNKGNITESTILKAVMKRASYFRANQEKVTFAGVRRLLEEDLKLAMRALDPYKDFIRQQLDKVLEFPDVSKSAKATAEKSVKKHSQKKALDGSDADSLVSEEEEDDEVKPKKKTASKGRMQKSEVLKKRKTPPKEMKTPSKRIKPEKAVSNSSNDQEDGERDSEDESQSSAEKEAKKREVSTPAYGKRVERLKSIIKACGMSVPPTVYRRVKQVPEAKREAHLIKELEDILSREGLSANPSEKEIKEVKRKKERARELEGIDMSNIVSSSRRRATSGYIPPPKPKIPVDSDGEESADSDEDDGDDEDDDEENDDNDEGNDESQSEDASEDQEESE